MRAHRVSWEIHFGPIPDGLWVLHHCDNPPCTRPDHLFLGTDADNAADKISKGRGGLTAPKQPAQGHRIGSAKLDEHVVRQIRTLAADGESAAFLARQFGVTAGAIYFVVTRRTWRHVA